ncbi:hypothetical protein ACFLTH_12740 [Bacteroidota bacterium]
MGITGCNHPKTFTAHPSMLGFSPSSQDDDQKIFFIPFRYEFNRGGTE